MRVLAVLGTATALLAPAPAPRQTCLAARSGIKTGTIMAEFEARQLAAMDRDEPPPFSAGDTVNVACEITEGTTKRIQNYAGVVIKRSGAGLTQTFTVRKMSSGIGVERTFPVYAPSVTKIEVLRRGSVRRSKLYYLRQLTGKSARIKEKIRGLSYVQRQEAAIAEKKAAALQPPPTPRPRRRRRPPRRRPRKRPRPRPRRPRRRRRGRGGRGRGGGGRRRRARRRAARPVLPPAAIHRPCYRARILRYRSALGAHAVDRTLV